MKPAPTLTTQSNGLLFGSPDGNEHTLSRSMLESAGKTDQPSGFSIRINSTGRFVRVGSGYGVDPVRVNPSAE